MLHLQHSVLLAPSLRYCGQADVGKFIHLAKKDLSDLSQWQSILKKKKKKLFMQEMLNTILSK